MVLTVDITLMYRMFHSAIFLLRHQLSVKNTSRGRGYWRHTTVPGVSQTHNSKQELIVEEIHKKGRDGTSRYAHAQGVLLIHSPTRSKFTQREVWNHYMTPAVHRESCNVLLQSEHWVK